MVLARLTVSRTAISIVASSLFAAISTGSLASTGDRPWELCETTFESRVPSPDRHWIAVVHEDICDAGLGSNKRELVELVSAAEPNIATPLMSVGGQWSDPNLVQVRWLTEYVLEVSVPNRTEVGEYRRLAGGVGVRVRYVKDNPSDRAAWLEWMKASYDALVNRGQIPTPPPPLPDE
jgi:hypothetical protein